MATITITESEAQRQANTEVKEWLWRYRRAKLNLQRLEGEYSELVSIQESAGAITYDGMPAASNSASDLSNLMVARDNVLSKVIRAKQNVLDTYFEITAALEELDSVERDVISLRYIQLKDSYGIRDFDEIADRIKYTKRYVQKVHGFALQKLSAIIKKRCTKCKSGARNVTQV